MGTRKNQATLTDDETQRYVSAVLQLKANGGYERYVAWHRELFWQGIHSSAMFLPWHRELILRFEQDLQAIDSSVDLPYWDWSVDQSPNASPWISTFLGGDGEGFNGLVADGPFAFFNGNFNIVETDPPMDPGPGLRRRLVGTETLPNPAQVRVVLRWNNYTNFNASIRGSFHNIPHRWVGGSMASSTSPNDPVFWMHHANLDRLWAVWQSLHPEVMHYEGSNDAMPPWFSATTPLSVVDHRTLGYNYDTDELLSLITDLTVGASPANADISRGAEVDVFRFIVSSFGTYTVETQGNTDVVASLMGPDSQADLVTENDDGGERTNSRIVSNLSPGTYFIRIRHYNPANTGSYTISVRTNATPPATIPEIVVNGQAVNGDIAATNESDVYIFTAAFSSVYTIETLGNTDTFLSLYGPDVQTNFIGQNDDSGQGLNSRIVIDLSPGIYYLRVRHYSPTGTGAYSISVIR